MIERAHFILVCLTLFVLPLSSALANDPMPSEESLAGAFKTVDTFSPYAGRNFPVQVLWGDTHVHTGLSMDAGAFGATTTPDDAYRFAKGQELMSSTGVPARLSKPLDFLVVADHSDNMGFFPLLAAGTPSFLADPTGRRWYDMIKAGGQEGVKVAVEVIQRFSNNTFPEALASTPGTTAYRDTWEQIIKAAEDHNDPGNFTAFIGFEWTSNDMGNNLHRVVMYRDGGHKASMVEPYSTVKPQGSPDPTKLWDWLEAYEAKTGGRIMALAHNGNLSNGIMFPMKKTYFGHKVNEAYATRRARWEPIYEVTQIKGDGETHPALSPNDEFADYETWDQGNLDLSTLKEEKMLQFEYARSGLGVGMQVENRVGVNPYKFGMIGATDSHTGLATAGEDNFFGKHSGGEPNADRWKHPMAKIGDLSYESYNLAASGLAGVWAKENTRAAIFDAMMRKETYATTGPRMTVRFFGGWEFEASDALTRQPAGAGYSKGVPMGGDLSAPPEDSSIPSFLVAARKDPISGNLDRIQVVKIWVDKSNTRHEKVYDVVWAGDRSPGADGKLPSVGSTVDIPNATWTNTIGEPELVGVWQDPAFDAKQPASYYARVLEIPTPRWMAYEAKRYGLTNLPEEVEMVTQERAYTSPIWYTPKKK